MKNSLLAATAVLALGFFAMDAKAADAEAPASAEQSAFYISLFGGASFLNDVETDYYGGTYEVSTKTGYLLGGAIGARIWDPVRAEIEVSYARWKADDYAFDYHDGNSGGSFAEGPISATYLLGNLWYDIDIASSFRPYIGGGAGVAFVDADIDLGGGGIGYGDGNTGFAFQLGAGVQFDLTEHIALDVGYRFKGILDVDFDDIDGTGVYKKADLYAHNVQAGVIFGF